MFLGVLNMNTLKKISSTFVDFSRKGLAIISAPTPLQGQIALFTLGIVILSSGLTLGVEAQIAGGGRGDVGTPSQITYNDARLAEALGAIFRYIEGTFGAMVMVAAGIAAIFSAAFGQYKAALGLLVVAVGSFILRSLVDTFFDTAAVQ